MVEDIDRPDANGVPPRMAKIAEAVKEAFGVCKLGHLKVVCDDNLCSNVTIYGAREPKEQWTNGIFQNSTHFIAHITPGKGKRYYVEGDSVKVEISSKRTKAKFRAYTGSPEKAIAKLVSWVNSVESDI